MNVEWNDAVKICCAIWLSVDSTPGLCLSVTPVSNNGLPKPAAVSMTMAGGSAALPRSPLRKLNTTLLGSLCLAHACLMRRH